jgi:hypothetical protein
LNQVIRFILCYVFCAVFAAIAIVFKNRHESAAMENPDCLFSTFKPSLTPVPCAWHLTGILIAARADNELYTFMESNKRRRALGIDPMAVLNTGKLMFTCLWP